MENKPESQQLDAGFEAEDPNKIGLGLLLLESGDVEMKSFTKEVTQDLIHFFLFNLNSPHAAPGLFS